MELHRALHSLSGELTHMGRVDEPDHVRVPVKLGDVRAVVQAGAAAFASSSATAPTVAPTGETLASIAQWCEETFGPATVERIVSRAAEEMEELKAEPHKADEVADVLIILSRYPGMWDAVQRKMAVNRARTWRVMGDGTGYHVKADGSTSAPTTSYTDPPATAAIRDVLAERRRQQDVEGWTPEHDDAHTVGEMADAAACYAARAHSVESIKRSPPPGRWPWSMKWWRPESVRRMLVKAAALLLAEIERLDRAEARSRIEAEGRPGQAGREGA